MIKKTKNLFFVALFSTALVTCSDMSKIPLQVNIFNDSKENAPLTGITIDYKTSGNNKWQSITTTINNSPKNKAACKKSVNCIPAKNKATISLSLNVPTQQKNMTLEWQVPSIEIDGNKIALKKPWSFTSVDPIHVVYKNATWQHQEKQIAQAAHSKTTSTPTVATKKEAAPQSSATLAITKKTPLKTSTSKKDSHKNSKNEVNATSKSKSNSSAQSITQKK